MIKNNFGSGQEEANCRGIERKMNYAQVETGKMRFSGKVGY